MSYLLFFDTNQNSLFSEIQQPTPAGINLLNALN